MYLQVARRRHPNATIASDTDVIIDGFPRTAGTFATVAFQFAQPSPVRVGHHLHAPAHLIAAVRRHIPALLTIREPDDTVISCVIREPYVSLAQALSAYARFHESLLPHRSRLVVADFAQITSDYGLVIDRMNNAFGTAYARFEHTPATVQQVFWVVDERSRRAPWAPVVGAFLSGRSTYAELVHAATAPDDPARQVPHLRVARPSPAKEQLKASLRDKLRSPSLAHARARARDAYAALLEGNDARRGTDV